MAGVAPGSKASAPPVDENTLVSGKSPKMKFDECTQVPEGTEKLALETLRHNGRYELEHGFRRRSSRMRHDRPRVSLLASDVPASCPDSAWSSYKVDLSLFHDRVAGRGLLC